MFDESHLIHRYARAQAIADGVLVDVSAPAKGAGSRFPVALTRAVWERCVAVPPGAPRRWCVSRPSTLTASRSASVAQAIRPD
jgi:hypothetical protein